MLKLINRISNRKITWFAALLFAGSVLPLLILGRYSVMFADDYSYGIGVHDAWVQTGSVWQAVKCAAEHTKSFYYIWQGTYASCFLMSMCPMHFNYYCTFIVPIIMIGMFSLSTYLLGRQVFIRWLGGDRGYYPLIGCMLLFLFWQVIDSPSDALYWYNGATHYVLMQSLMFLMVTAVSGILWTDSRRNMTLWCILSSVCGAIVGGGNLVTGLQAQVLMLFLLGYTFLKKRVKTIYAAVPAVCYTVGFMINILAPGNAARGGGLDEGYGVVQSILLSFYNAFVYIGKWTVPMLLIVWIAVMPALWQIVQNSEGKFRYPGLVTLAFFCIFSAMFTPTLFAMGVVGIGRINNIIQMVYYLGLFSVTAYWFGWFTHRDGFVQKHDVSGGHGQKINQYGTIVTVTALIVTAAVWMFTTDKNTYAGISALRSLVIGDAQTYYEEEMERYEMYLDDDIQYVIVEVHTAKPYLFGDVDLNWDSQYWINQSVAHYYHKDKVVRRVE